MELKVSKPFYGMTFIWNTLKKFLPANITDNIRGMRAFKDLTGAVFDVAEHDIARFDDIFDHLKEEKRIDFEIGRAKSLPELKEEEGYGGASGGYGAQRYGGGGGGYGGGQSYGGG
jgi:hypothetical protein